MKKIGRIGELGVRSWELGVRSWELGVGKRGHKWSRGCTVRNGQK
ncbi:MAG: hypothetical protein PHZ24_02340 [Bacteroidales bacterium]|nr:hypothetical protein [Bacteroidales bacterium]